MHRRLALALSLSALLIGGASVYRFAYAGHVTYALTTVQQGTSSADDITVVDHPIGDSTSATSSSASANVGNLTTTDLVGRQLMNDYIGIAAHGDVTSDQVAALADKYVQNVPAIAQAPTISADDLHSVPDNQSNLQVYATNIAQIHKAWISYLKQLVGSNGDNLASAGAASYTYSEEFGNAYDDTAKKLESIPVPASLIEVHTKLINSYLTSGASMLAMSTAQNDPVTLVANAIALKDSLSSQDALLAQIGDVLSSHGL